VTQRPTHYLQSTIRGGEHFDRETQFWQIAAIRFTYVKPNESKSRSKSGYSFGYEQPLSTFIFYRGQQ